MLISPAASTSFLAPGTFSVGANYWASHAGPAMWRRWRPEIIGQDFALLAGEGLQLLRVFPLWPDFQPITGLRGHAGRFIEFRMGESPLPEDQVVPNGVDPVMLDRFGVMLDLAAKHRLQLIVGLITGWMSGRLFVPPALEGLNPITDPASLLWQIRLVQALVGRFRNHPAIKAWDLGNECNCMGMASREQAWLWSSALANAIRASDSTRPIISGMHSLGVDPQTAWSIRDQGEITDILTTHPYPLFTAHCHREPLNTMRPLLHATAETCLYGDLSKKPALVEEFGTLGPMILGDREAAGFMRTSLVSLWAHDARAALWWCAHDQVSLEDAPHDWIALERELGLVREDKTPKPALREMKAFREVIGNLSFTTLPPRQCEAVCLLTPGQDQWGVAYSAFILAKQAGFDLRFHYADRALPEAQLYLVPSVCGLTALSRRRERELWDKVRAGATAYLSLDDGLLGKFSEATGMEILTRSERKGPCAFQMKEMGERFSLPSSVQYEFKARRARVLAREDSGQPVFSVAPLGKGKVYLLTVPLEAALAGEVQLFTASPANPHGQLYRTLAAEILQKRILGKKNPLLGVTEHPSAKDEMIAVLINYSAQELEDLISVSGSHRLDQIEVGPEPGLCPSGQYQLKLPPHGYAVWKLTHALILR